MKKKKLKKKTKALTVRNEYTALTKKDKQDMAIYKSHPISQYPDIITRQEFENLSPNDKICAFYYCSPSLGMSRREFCKWAKINIMSFFHFKRRNAQLGSKLKYIANSSLDYEIMETDQRLVKAIREGKTTAQHFKFMELLYRRKRILGADTLHQHLHLPDKKPGFVINPMPLKQIENNDIIDVEEEIKEK